MGGARNWDYRYAWVRDASFTIEALWVAACPDEANEFFDYMTTSAAGSLDRGGDLQIMFGIGGERDLTERELPHLEGWRHSAPVRVGNGAWSQRQLDVYGELLSAVYRLSDHLFDNATRRVGPMAAPDKWGAPPDLAPVTRRFLVQLADTAALRWQEKDQGIWEVRSEPRDFLYSKLMCWVALDRAVALADHLGASDRVEAWKQTQDQIREAILTRGWSDRVNAFTQSFGSDELDASSRCCLWWGCFPPTILECWPRSTRQKNASLMIAGWCIATGPTTGSRAKKARSFCAPSGWLKPWPEPDSRPEPAPSSTGPPPS